MLKASIPLFNERVLSRELTQYLNENSVPSAEMVRKVQEWNLRAKGGLFRTYTETQLEQSFLRLLFVDALGYSLIGNGPTHTLAPKRTAKTGQDIPDFVLAGRSPPSDRQ